jgi:uncharacterized protein (DUF1499 family)
MLKKILLAVLVLLLVFVVFVVVRFSMLGAESSQASAPGLVNGQLTRCPASPNCFNSEFADDTDHYTAPVTLVQKDPAVVKDAAVAAITAMGGEVTATDGPYIAATFTSKLFRFVDDFELRIDEASGEMHIRSASRVGYGDMGVNAERVAEFKEVFANQVSANRP